MAEKLPFKIFIGSSTESKKYATWIQDVVRTIQQDEPNDAYELSADGWWQDGIFKMMYSFYESLNVLVGKYDAAILVGGKDDLTIERQKIDFQPRDNIILELGLFAGAKGKELALLATVDIPELPSDLAGVCTADIKSANNYEEFQILNRGAIRAWLIQAMDYKNHFCQSQKLAISDPRIESMMMDMIKDIGNALKVDNEIFQSTMRTNLSIYATDISNWAMGTLYVGPDRSMQFLIALYRKAKKVFSTSVKDFASAWKDNLFGEEILNAHIVSGAEVTRVFIFNNESDVNNDDIEEIEKQEKNGIKVLLFFENYSPINIPTDISRDFTIIDDRIIGVTESFGKTKYAARYYFKMNRKDIFFNFKNQLKNASMTVADYKKSFLTSKL